MHCPFVGQEALEEQGLPLLCPGRGDQTRVVGHALAALALALPIFLVRVYLSSNDFCGALRRLSLSLRGHCAFVRCAPGIPETLATGPLVTWQLHHL